MWERLFISTVWSKVGTRHLSNLAPGPAKRTKSEPDPGTTLSKRITMSSTISLYLDSLSKEEKSARALLKNGG